MQTFRGDRGRSSVDQFLGGEGFVGVVRKAISEPDAVAEYLQQAVALAIALQIAPGVLTGIEIMRRRASRR